MTVMHTLHYEPDELHIKQVIKTIKQPILYHTTTAELLKQDTPTYGFTSEPLEYLSARTEQKVKTVHTRHHVYDTLFRNSRLVFYRDDEDRTRKLTKVFHVVNERAVILVKEENTIAKLKQQFSYMVSIVDDLDDVTEDGKLKVETKVFENYKHKGPATVIYYDLVICSLPANKYIFVHENYKDKMFELLSRESQLYEYIKYDYPVLRHDKAVSLNEVAVEYGMKNRPIRIAAIGANARKVDVTELAFGNLSYNYFDDVFKLDGRGSVYLEHDSISINFSMNKSNHNENNNTEANNTTASTDESIFYKFIISPAKLCIVNKDSFFLTALNVRVYLNTGIQTRCSIKEVPFMRGRGDVRIKVRDVGKMLSIVSMYNVLLYANPRDSSHCVTERLRACTLHLDFESAYAMECFLSGTARYVTRVTTEDARKISKCDLLDFIEFAEDYIKDYITMDELLQRYKKSLKTRSDKKENEAKISNAKLNEIKQKNKMNMQNKILNQRNKIYDASKKNDRYYSTAEEEYENEQIKINSAVIVKSCTITPLRVIFHYKASHASNRVLREFESDKFLRVCFKDEDGEQIDRGRVVDTTNLFDHFRDILLDGLVCSSRKFFFVASSSSQLRLHSCWFMTPYETETLVGPDFVRGWIGEFAHIHNIGMYAVRLGQAFSTTAPSFIVDDFVVEEDIVNNGHVFSDGIGLISQPLGNAVAKLLGLNHTPASYQIRFAGFKGVVTVSNCDHDLVMRKSMQKFISNHRVLEIVGVSQRRQCYFNRQIIMILEALGVPNSVFIELFDDYLLCGQQKVRNNENDNSYRNDNTSKNDNINDNNSKSDNINDNNCSKNDNSSRKNNNNKDNNSRKDNNSKIDSNGNWIVINDNNEGKTKVINNLVNDNSIIGVDKNSAQNKTGELKVRQNVNPDALTITTKYTKYTKYSKFIDGSALDDVINKTRILVPRGRVLMGILDESGILKEDEVFVMSRAYEDDVIDKHVKKYGNFIVVQSAVLVAKNPCLHPGDIRVVRAVDRPELHHLKEVLVFSKLGSRPVFNMCSGSDLDGDLYAVSWEPKVIPKRVYTPFSYRSNPVLFKQNCAVRDVVNFFIKYMQEDQIGMIANSHLAHSDQVGGVTAPQCLHLAALFNMGIDFPKTGYVASLPIELVPNKYPDFMEKSSSYLSENIVGILYRRSIIFRIFLEAVSSIKKGVHLNRVLDNFKDIRSKDSGIKHSNIVMEDDKNSGDDTFKKIKVDISKKVKEDIFNKDDKNSDEEDDTIKKIKIDVSKKVKEDIFNKDDKNSDEEDDTIKKIKDCASSKKVKEDVINKVELDNANNVKEDAANKVELDTSKKVEKIQVGGIEFELINDINQLKDEAEEKNESEINVKNSEENKPVIAESPLDKQNIIFLNNEDSLEASENNVEIGLKNDSIKTKEEENIENTQINEEIKVNKIVRMSNETKRIKGKKNGDKVKEEIKLNGELDFHINFISMLCDNEQVLKRVEEEGKKLYDIKESFNNNTDILLDYTSKYYEIVMIGMFDYYDEVHLVGRDNYNLKLLNVGKATIEIYKEIFRQFIVSHIIKSGDIKVRIRPGTLYLVDVKDKYRNNNIKLKDLRKIISFTKDGEVFAMFKNKIDVCSDNSNLVDNKEDSLTVEVAYKGNKYLLRCEIDGVLKKIIKNTTLLGRFQFISTSPEKGINVEVFSEKEMDTFKGLKEGDLVLERKGNGYSYKFSTEDCVILKTEEVVAVSGKIIKKNRIRTLNDHNEWDENVVVESISYFNGLGYEHIVKYFEDLWRSVNLHVNVYRM